mmetsp:Transcript_119239/g.338082  ORF Transcript_119239/g.338082 Transcript_119239/m.338082 type:complete len:363 (+) Transcript_119239:229-1317(+)
MSAANCERTLTSWMSMSSPASTSSKRACQTRAREPSTWFQKRRPGVADSGNPAQRCVADRPALDAHHADGRVLSFQVQRLHDLALPQAPHRLALRHRLPVGDDGLVDAAVEGAPGPEEDRAVGAREGRPALLVVPRRPAAHAPDAPVVLLGEAQLLEDLAGLETPAHPRLDAPLLGEHGLRADPVGHARDHQGEALPVDLAAAPPGNVLEEPLQLLLLQHVLAQGLRHHVRRAPGRDGLHQGGEGLILDGGTFADGLEHLTAGFPLGLHDAAHGRHGLEPQVLHLGDPHAVQAGAPLGQRLLRASQRGLDRGRALPNFRQPLLHELFYVRLRALESTLQLFHPLSTVFKCPLRRGQLTLRLC